MKLGVVGLGYVGQPLVIEMCKAGFEVVGFDISNSVIEDLNRGISRIEDVNKNVLRTFLNERKLTLSSNPESLKSCDLISICVPTPVDADLKPDLSIVENAVKLISPIVGENTIIVLESTVATGDTRRVVYDEIKKHKEFEPLVGFSPERVDPGRKDFTTKNIPKIISGSSEKALERLESVYSRIFKVVRVSSMEVAEMSKIYENTFRLVNMALAHELQTYCRKVSLSAHEIISASATKPFGFMPFYPNVGVGGHCIPVDPLFWYHSAYESGVTLDLVKHSSEITRAVPKMWISEISDTIIRKRLTTVVIFGISYKPNIADIRESPSREIFELARKQLDVPVMYYDEYVQDFTIDNKTITSILKEDLTELSNSLLFIATNHDYTLQLLNEIKHKTNIIISAHE
jgi:UDP-N-acetyl-D-glucosamine dehydrogenase